MKKKNGYTVIELIITLAILVIIALLVLSSTGGCRFNRKEASIASANNYLKELNLYDSMKAVTCTTYDTDNDGYNTCTVIFKDDKTMSLQCANGRWFGRTEGCKLTGPSIMNNVNN